MVLFFAFWRVRASVYAKVTVLLMRYFGTAGQFTRFIVVALLFLGANELQSQTPDETRDLGSTNPIDPETAPRPVATAVLDE